jgi:chromosome segregation ATPase
VKGEEGTVVRYAASEEHIAELEGELKGAADQEAETAQRFNRERQQRVALDQQLHQAGEEAARLILDEASQTRNALRAEALIPRLDIAHLPARHHESRHCVASTPSKS